MEFNTRRVIHIRLVELLMFRFNMTNENSKILTKRFPYLYRNSRDCPFWERPPNVLPSIPFEFECGDGWFALLYDLSEKLETIISAISPTDQKRIYVLKVRSRSGRLQFCPLELTKKMYEVVREAEAASYHICETCSGPSIVLGLGYLVNACRNCWVQHHRRASLVSVETAEEYYDALKSKHNQGPLT